MLITAAVYPRSNGMAMRDIRHCRTVSCLASCSVVGCAARVRGGEVSMRSHSKSMIVAMIFLALTLPIFGQESTPKVELGMGYSFAQLHVPGPTDTANINGVQFDTTYNLNRWLGFTAEYTGHFRCLQGCFWSESISRQKATTFTAGPRFSLNRRARIIPWVHLLGGVSNVSFSKDSFTADPGIDKSSTGLAVVAGGGVDFRLKGFLVRPIQVDLLRHKVGDNTRNDIRIGVGVAIGLGKASKKRS
jgi:hypothetical protein